MVPSRRPSDFERPSLMKMLDHYVFNLQIESRTLLDVALMARHTSESTKLKTTRTKADSANREHHSRKDNVTLQAVYHSLYYAHHKLVPREIVHKDKIGRGSDRSSFVSHIGIIKAISLNKIIFIDLLHSGLRNGTLSGSIY